MGGAGVESTPVENIRRPKVDAWQPQRMYPLSGLIRCKLSHPERLGIFFRAAGETVRKGSVMMRKFLTAAAMVLTAGVLLPVARAAAPAEVQKAIQADYNDRDGAVSRKDVEGTLAHYAPNFTSISTAGKVHDLKEERADFLKTFRLPAKSSVTKSTIQKVALGKAGTEAFVTVRRHGLLMLTDPQTQLNHVLALDGVYQDTWDKRSGVWQLTREQASSFKPTMDGRPI